MLQISLLFRNEFVYLDSLSINCFFIQLLDSLLGLILIFVLNVAVPQRYSLVVRPDHTTHYLTELTGHFFQVLSAKALREIFDENIGILVKILGVSFEADSYFESFDYFIIEILFGIFSLTDFFKRDECESPGLIRVNISHYFARSDLPMFLKQIKQKCFFDFRINVSYIQSRVI